jgi:protein involved in polysaccharide export with SLBB domain
MRLPETGESKCMRFSAAHAGVYLCLSLAAAACVRETTKPVALPPMDAPPAPAVFGMPSVYRIRPGDLLRVKFLYHPELDVKVPVRPDGEVTLQVAGNIHVAGMTTTEVEEIVKQRTSDRLREPEISVIVAGTADQRVYVGGEVRVPGFVVYSSGMTPLQAIMDRGGFTDTARMDSVLRLTPSHPEYRATRLDFTRPLDEGSPEWTLLSGGDVLYVPRTFIGDVGVFVRLYIRDILPIQPRIGAGTTF